MLLRLYYCVYIPGYYVKLRQNQRAYLMEIETEMQLRICKERHCNYE